MTSCKLAVAQGLEAKVAPLTCTELRTLSDVIYTAHILMYSKEYSKIMNNGQLSSLKRSHLKSPKCAKHIIITAIYHRTTWQHWIFGSDTRSSKFLDEFESTRLTILQAKELYILLGKQQLLTSKSHFCSKNLPSLHINNIKHIIIIIIISSFFNEGKTTSVTSTAFQAGPPYTKII